VVKARAVQALILRGGPTIPEGTLLWGAVRAAGRKLSSDLLRRGEAESKHNDAETVDSRGHAARWSSGGPRYRASPPEVSSSPRRTIPGGDFDHRPASASGRQPAATGTAATEVSQPGRNVAAQTGSVIGMPGATLQVDEGPEHASRFAADKELPLKGGVQFRLAVAEK
jgi:hypothetical protein